MADRNTNLNIENSFVNSKGSQKNEKQILTHDEIWDDEALIQHYDESLKRAKIQLACKLNSGTSISDSDCSMSQRMKEVNGYAHGKSHHTSHSKKKKKKKKSRKKNEWHTGDPCRALYSGDGKTYEATIIGLDNTSGMCHVRFLGYNNDEHLALSSLLKSRGEGARKKQLEEAAEIYSQSDADDSCVTESDITTEDDSNKTDNEMPPIFHTPKNSNQRKALHSIPTLPLLPPPPALGLMDSNDLGSSEALHTMLMSWYMTGYHTGYYQGMQHCRSGHSQPSSSSKNSQFSHKKNKFQKL